MTGKPLLSLAWEAIRNARGEQPFWLCWFGLALAVGIFVLFRSMYRLAHLTIDDLDEAERGGEI
jgi:hypothetical protein